MARAAATFGTMDNGVMQITLNLSAEDTYGMPWQVASLRMSLEDAKRVRADLDAQISAAEKFTP
jgi:hypothetical protein